MSPHLSLLRNLPKYLRPSAPRSSIRPLGRALHGTSIAFAGHLPPRNAGFKKIEEQDRAFFRSILPEQAVRTSDLGPFNTDWMNKYHGKSDLVLFPRTTEQVSKILKHCNDNSIAVVPQGGNTGLVGGGVPVYDELILNMSAMNKIRHFDSASGVVVCDAGCILESLEETLGAEGFITPLDLGAKGSCHIGGNVATNAGGLRFLRYGSLHGSVMGLEVVTADGTILDNLSILHKDNTGYDLKQLFIGSEGTLGIITGVSIWTPPKPKSVKVALVGLDSFKNVQATYEKTKTHLNEILSAFEFWDKESLKLVLSHSIQGTRDPFDDQYPFYVLIETHGSNAEHDDAKLQGLLEDLMEGGEVVDGVVAQDESQSQSLWGLRESIPEACSKAGAVYKYDVSMPQSVLYQLVEDMREHMRSKGALGSKVTDVIGYGHVGDGNLHLNISAPKYTDEVQSLIEPFVYEWIQGHRGSISAEHGLGVMKGAVLPYSKSPEMIGYMRKIKEAFDPKGILNPYKYLPLTESK
ncbi:hypothetical protein BJ684DRAFT_20563 [Piptocephalis cylindrospora]|uniref:FAD-binding PCMH-type domain-containing protein n=1 Tax=Piptocephalis cylindrospora TaxID=1907219 RepID=A0A4P9Y2U3_9FUNG|nr:hypothetical protein BJ684DRAFT_20563 [Piptocephalis cylindrospora]|eukprot:RKP12922.1 hypothetical protein BJ684DRAFT_20563 [Piptocephalis cylindrospora]